MPELNEKALAEIVKLARSYSAPPQHAGNTDFVVIPADMKCVDLSGYTYNQNAPTPNRTIGTAKVLDALSFIEYWKLFHSATSRVFADETKSQIVAVLDYHAADSPHWGQHRIDFTLRHSEEWKTWTAHDGNGKKTNQMDFSEFLETNAPDIVQPDAATMLEVARSLYAKTEVDFGSAIRIANGSVQFKFTEAVKGTYGSGNVEVPESFVIRVPVYIGCERVEVTARLRYRINGGKLTFWYDLLRADAVERTAFMILRAFVENELGITVINGSPA
jgi:uncharacterized protein YfdQ (DUF2303 family)